jgi:N-acetylglucosamine-6-phosphate deacetylase
LCFCLAGHAQDDRSTEHNEGLRENVPSDYAITNVKIVVSAGTVIEKGTIVVREGKIASVSTIENTIPTDLKVIDLNGKTLYPGLIDGFTEQDVDTSELEAGAAYWNAYIRPQLSTADQYKVDNELNSKMRKQGVTARLVAPAGGILKGTSCFVLTDGSSVADSLLKSNVAQHGRLTVSRRFGGSGTRPSYPNSPMGAVALARQAMYDA